MSNAVLNGGDDQQVLRSFKRRLRRDLTRCISPTAVPRGLTFCFRAGDPLLRVHAQLDDLHGRPPAVLSAVMLRKNKMLADSLWENLSTGRL